MIGAPPTAVCATAGSAAAPAARCRNCLRRGSFTLNLPLPLTSFDDLVGACEQRRWHVEAKCLRGLEVDNQFVARNTLIFLALPCDTPQHQQMPIPSI